VCTKWLLQETGTVRKGCALTLCVGRDNDQCQLRMLFHREESQIYARLQSTQIYVDDKQVNLTLRDLCSGGRKSTRREHLGGRPLRQQLPHRTQQIKIIFDDQKNLVGVHKQSPYCAAPNDSFIDYIFPEVTQNGESACAAVQFHRLRGLLVPPLSRRHQRRTQRPSLTADSGEGVSTAPFRWKLQGADSQRVHGCGRIVLVTNAEERMPCFSSIRRSR